MVCNSRIQPGVRRGLPYTTCWRAVGGAGGTTTRHRPVGDTLENQRARPGRPRRLGRSTHRPVRHFTGQQSAAAPRKRTRGARTPTSRPRLRVDTIQNSTEAGPCRAFARPLPKRAAMRPQRHFMHGFTLLEDQERNPVRTTTPCPDQVPQRSLKRSMRPMMPVKERQRRPKRPASKRPASIEQRHREQQQGNQQQKRRWVRLKRLKRLKQNPHARQEPRMRTAVMKATVAAGIALQVRGGGRG